MSCALDDARADSLFKQLPDAIFGDGHLSKPEAFGIGFLHQADGHP
jgi:hypothetical protein